MLPRLQGDRAGRTLGSLVIGALAISLAQCSPSTRVTTNPSPAPTIRPSPSQRAPVSVPGASTTWITYWSESPFPSIWAIHPDGSGNHRLLANRQNAKRPRLSPDRKWVAFDGTPPGKPVMSDFDIQLVAFDGTGLRTLTSTSDWDLDAQWSPDGQWIAFTRNPPSPTDCAESTVWVMRRDGSQAHSVGPGCVVRWSPDGRQLAFADQATLAIKLVNVDGSDVRTLARSTFTQQPDGFSPDGTSILLTRAADVSGRSTQIMLLSLGTGSLRSLALGDAACWSPDGSAILYTNGLESPLSIMGPEGSHQRVLISVAASEPDWR